MRLFRGYPCHEQRASPCGPRPFRASGQVRYAHDPGLGPTTVSRQNRHPRERMDQQRSRDASWVRLRKPFGDDIGTKTAGNVLGAVNLKVGSGYWVGFRSLAGIHPKANAWKATALRLIWRQRRPTLAACGDGPTSAPRGRTSRRCVTSASRSGFLRHLVLRGQRWNGP